MDKVIFTTDNTKKEGLKTKVEVKLDIIQKGYFCIYNSFDSFKEAEEWAEWIIEQIKKI